MGAAELDLDRLDFGDDRVKGFDTLILKRLLRDVWDILCEQGRVGQPDLVEGIDVGEYGWKEHYIRSRILPRLRRLLEEESIISVEEESADQGPFDRTVWVLDT